MANGGQGTITYTAQATGTSQVLPVTATTILPQGGTYVLTATYNSAGATSSPTEMFVVTKAPSKLTLYTSSTVADMGSSVILKAIATFSAAGIPTGTVTFFSGPLQLGTVVLDAQGVASLPVNDLQARSDTISAEYGGDVDFLATTAQLGQSIRTGVPSFSISANLSSSITKQGKEATISVILRPQYGYHDAIALTCLDLPPDTTCVFSPATVVFSGNNQPMVSQLTFNTWGSIQNPVAANQPPKRPSEAPSILMAGSSGCQECCSAAFSVRSTRN